MRIEASVLEAPPGRARDDDGGDTRFRALMRPEDWASLPAAIRRRFSKRLANGATVLYAGEVLETTMSRMGWLWAQVLRLIGGPLPLTRNRHVPAVVVVTEDHASRGQIWTRLYGRPGGFAQVVQSCQRLSGPTGVAGYVGFGLGLPPSVPARP